MAQQIQIRRGTAADAASVNPVLAEGEQGYEVDTGVVKIGDGVTAWSLLPVAFTVGDNATPLERAALGLDQMLAWDTFNRADNAGSLGTSDSGHAWSANVGTWGISGNRARLFSAPGTNDHAVLDVNEADVELAVDMAAPDAAGGWLIFRYINANNFLRLSVAQVAGELRLIKREAGVNTTLAFAAFSPVADLLYRMTVTARADKITLAIDGQQVVSHTLSAGDLATFGLAGKHGIGGVQTTVRFDNFVVRSLA